MNDVHTLQAEIQRLQAEIAAGDEWLHTENQRLQAEIAARDEQRTRTEIAWLNHVNDAIFLTDADWQIQEWNQAAEQIYGWARAETIGKPIWKVIPVVRYFHGESDASATQQLTQHGSWRGTFVQCTRDGRELVIDASTRAIVDAHGAITGYIGVNRDISAQALAEQERSEQARALELTHVLVFNLNNHITLWTRGAEQLYGYSKAEALGQVPHTLLQTQFPEPLEQIMDTLHRSGRWSSTLIHRTRAGQSVAVASEWILERDAEGRPYRIVEANTDITELLRANTRLHVLADASHLFAQAGLDYTVLLESIAQIVSRQLAAVSIIRLLSNDGKWLVLGALYNQGIDVPIAYAQTMMSETVSVDSSNPTAVALRSGQSVFMPTIEVEAQQAYLTDDQLNVLQQHRPRSSIVVPLQMYGRSIGTISFLRLDPQQPPFNQDDLRLAQELAERAALSIANARLYETAQHELEARKRAEQALVDEHARVVQLKNEFMATMSHELRTPLTAVLGYTELLQDQVYGPLSERQELAIERIDQNGHNLLALINDILDYTKFEAGKTVLDIGYAAVPALCAASIELVRASAQAKQIRLTSTLDSQAVVIDADARRLQQVVVNLLANAVKFTPKGGQVGLEVRGDVEQQLMLFSVWDTGIGIAQEDLSKLFKPFTQLDSRLSREYEGTGLGLALVRRIAEAHGGSVSVESTPGQGSRFSVMLPWQPTVAPTTQEVNHAPKIAVSASATITAPPSASTAAAADLPTILLVEDHYGNMMFVQEVLNLHGYPLFVANNASDGLTLARDQRPALVLMDIQLPGMSGLEAIQRMRADDDLQQIPIIALTSLVLPGDRERCLKAGADEYLPKPVSSKTLVATIEQLLRERPA